jgi:hypothetical protein
MKTFSLTAPINFFLVTIVMIVLGMVLNRLVIEFGPNEFALSALIYGPYSIGAGASGFLFLGLGGVFAAYRRWIKVLSLFIVGTALLYFSYGISLEMEKAARAEQLPEMVADSVGCFPDRLTGALANLDIVLRDSVELCSEA